MALCALAPASAGCGTTANQNGDCWWHTCYMGPANQPYGGAEQDWDLLTSIHGLGGDELGWGNVFSASLALFDLPFSAVGDTVTLPYDVWVTMTRQREPAEADKTTAKK